MNQFRHNRPDWLRQAVFYQIFPASFADSNADGIGDLRGIQDHLDYICSLGANALWLNPIYDSPFRDGGYDIRDYKTIAQRYGSMQDFDDLVAAAHARGMHVLLDLVPGHTSDEHDWFTASATAEHNDLSERFIWTDSWISSADGLPFTAGVQPRDGAYVNNFFEFQPALNYGFAHPSKRWQSPALGEEALRTCDAMLDVMRFWLERGADGFRVDMADSLVKQDDANKEATIATWQYMFSKIRAEFPEAAFVAEWGRPYQSFEAGFDMDFYLDWRWDGVPNGYNLLLRNTDTPLDHANDLSYFNADSPMGIQEFVEQYVPQLRDSERLHGFFNFITANHDTRRVSPRLSEHEIMLAYATLLTLPGVPFIYYGDEIATRYRMLPTLEGAYTRTGTRTPMQWDNAQANAGFSQAANAEDLYLPIDLSAEAPDVAGAMADEQSLWHVMHNVIELREHYAALAADGGFDVLFSDATRRPFVFKRTSAIHEAADTAITDDVIIAVNPSRADEQITLPALPTDGERTLSVVYSIANDAGAAVHINTADATAPLLQLPAQSFAILTYRNAR